MEFFFRKTSALSPELSPSGKQSQLRVKTQSGMIPLRGPSALARFSPARRGDCLRCGRVFPSHVPSSGSRRHTEGFGGLWSSGPF